MSGLKLERKNRRATSYFPDCWLETSPIFIIKHKEKKKTGVNYLKLKKKKKVASI